VSADEYSARRFGAPAFAAFDPDSSEHRNAAAALHDALVAAGFGPGRAAALFGLTEIASVRPSRTAYYDAFVLPNNAAGAAARFFVLHEPQPDAELRAWLGDAAVDFLTAMAALVPSDGRLRSLVSATWFAGRLIFADARAYNAIWPQAPFADYVMPPGGDSVGLERVAPRTHRRATLDLCCGAGAQTLAAAAYSERVVGVDVNERALRFARFNAAVNRVARAEFVYGDAYAPLGAARFDAIVANPPFVPWPEDDAELLYRGGGPRGDDVLARILSGAVEHLEPDGTLTIVADLANVASLPARIAEWQGEARRTLILLQHHHELLDYAETHAAHYDSSSERQAQTVRLLRHFERSGIRSLDFGYIVQDANAGPAFVQRTAAALAGSVSGDVAAWFAHQQQLARGEIADLPLQLAPHVALVDVAERPPAGEVTASCYVTPGPGSIHEAGAVSRAAFGLLIRVAAGGVRVRDVNDPAAVRELAMLLARGLLRFAS
jgi:carbamoyltransferase